MKFTVNLPTEIEVKHVSVTFPVRDHDDEDKQDMPLRVGNMWSGVVGPPFMSARCSMTKAELAEFERSIKGMTPHNHAWILNRDVAKLISEIRSKDALIADLFAFATTTTPDDSPYIEYQERLAALKARAEK